MAKCQLENRAKLKEVKEEQETKHMDIFNFFMYNKPLPDKKQNKGNHVRI